MSLVKGNRQIYDYSMTALAERLIKDFATLDPQEQMVVRNHVLSLTQERQLQAIERLRGSAKGEHLLEKLLKNRAEERARG
jgi:hypothetical protein